MQPNFRINFYFMFNEKSLPNIYFSSFIFSIPFYYLFFTLSFFLFFFFPIFKYFEYFFSMYMNTHLNIEISKCFSLSQIYFDLTSVKEIMRTSNEEHDRSVREIKMNEERDRIAHLFV